jgi:hypothetical protein
MLGSDSPERMILRYSTFGREQSGMMVQMPRRSHKKRLAIIALGTASLVSSGCSGSQHPNADAAGLFPHDFSERGFMDPGSTLFRATAAQATTTSYTFDVDLPTNQAFALVANCTTGTVSAFGASGPCHNGVGGMLGFCAGGHFHVTARVSQAQSRKWGVAFYRTPPCDTQQDPRKESPTPAL